MKTIAFIHTTEIRLYDLPYCLRQCGYRVEELEPRISAKVYELSKLAELTELCRKYEPDYLFTYDFSQTVSSVAMELDVPYLCWVYDSPLIELYTREALNPCNHVLTFDRKQAVRLRELGISKVYETPLAVRREAFGESHAQCRQTEDAGEITMIGQLYHDPKLHQLLSEAPEAVRLEMDGLLERYFLKWDGASSVFGTMSQETVDYYDRCNSLSVRERYPSADRGFYYETAVLGRMLAERERVGVLNRLSQEYEVHLYTFDQDTSMLDRHVRVLPGSMSQEVVADIYRNSRINLNLTLHTIETGACQRVFDCMASGGFVLSNYQEELAELFVENEEIVLYHNERELYDKIAYYLSHDAERRAIAEQGCRRVRQYYDFRCVLPPLMQQVQEAEQRRTESYRSMKDRQFLMLVMQLAEKHMQLHQWKEAKETLEQLVDPPQEVHSLIVMLEQLL